ncbi:DUF5819 family protein [Streptomyces sp. LP11]|uniref:DUF5819 family protein n=1 Tax=Streptomyces pyxinicus TaxID=2970331 RepID=A0ABT2B027_9ACTN|nr:DUF5819 family protein [Streptomyces sp. LP11]MCS0601760.1 DUF5819 family protein [Streptomyces sp. LP11]
MDANDEDSGARRSPGALEPFEPLAQAPSARSHDSGTGGPGEPVRGADVAGRAGADEPERVSDAGGSEDAADSERGRTPGAGQEHTAGARQDSTGGSGQEGTAGSGRDGTAGSGQDGSGEPPAPSPRTGLAALSSGYQVVAALALAVVVVAACVHLAMVFLSLAPSNTVSKQHGKAIEEWIYPEFEQNWKLFAPNPLQQNINVQARAEVRLKDGDLRTTGWTDLSALDGAAIEHNPVPSHTQQNELRRAWDFFTATHSADNRAVGMRGALSEQYVRRIVVMRLYRDDPTSKEGVIQRVQVRSSTTNVQPPKWSRERVSDKPGYRQLPWWSVTADEAAGGVR